MTTLYLRIRPSIVGPVSSLRRRAIIVLTTIGVTACAVDNTIQLAPEAVTTDSLVFVIAHVGGDTPPGSADGLSVIRCGDERSFWTIASDGSKLMPAQIAYGQAPAGFITHNGPDSLRAGCYKAVVSGAKPVTFDVSPAGRVSVR